MCLAPCSIVLVVLPTRSYRPLRYVSFGWRFSRHFVPGYDRTVPPGQLDNSQQALARCCCLSQGDRHLLRLEKSTLLLRMSASASRRDDTDRSLARSAWENVPRKNRPVGYGMIGYEGQQQEGLGQDAKQILPGG